MISIASTAQPAVLAIWRSHRKPQSRILVSERPLALA